MKKKVALIVIDALGVGELPDADKYGDRGANTFVHVYEKCKPNIPNLTDMGIMAAAGLECEDEPLGCFGKLREKAMGKDTTTGHWEIAGLTLNKPFPTYPDGFPDNLISAIEDEIGMQVIGNKAASGTAIIDELGVEHIKTGKPIVYTSADSVFQVAAHEAVIPPAELWHICRLCRKVLTGDHAVGRVIARPFVGNPGSFTRTAFRKDFSLDPVRKTLLDLMKESGHDVVGVGKIEDIFNNRGLTASKHVTGNAACIDATIEALKKPQLNGLVFTNLVDTDMLYGHRNDVEGYARCLEEIDRRLPEIMRCLGDEDVLIITGDHGCDPAFPGTDHTREYVPLLAWSLAANEGVDLGTRDTFADISATILDLFGVKNTLDGRSFWPEMKLD
ncbi:MAG: phosphopentomutase [Clostridia bacterium]|nr:phosphopentomutase [Clostridia bacterium]